MKTIIWTIPALFIGMQTAAMAATIAPGTEVPVRPDEPVHVNTWDRGRIYPAHVARDVYGRDGAVAIPQGSSAELIVRQIGPDELALDLESVTVNGQRYAMDTTGPRFNMPESSVNNGSGIVGNIIGAIAAANGEQVETRGRRVWVPEGALLRFQLQEPLHVVQWNDPGYMNGHYHYHHEPDWYR